MTVLEIDATLKARRDAADVAVLERAQEILRARSGQHLKRTDVHQAERELGHRLTITADR